MFSWYKYLIVSLGHSHLGFWSLNLFLIAPFPDLCLFVPFQPENFVILLIFVSDFDKLYQNIGHRMEMNQK